MQTREKKIEYELICDMLQIEARFKTMNQRVNN